MSSCHIKKVSLLEASRQQSSPLTSTLNTTDISLNNASLESYKKALHNIVRRLNKTPSSNSNSKATLRRSDSKLNQSQQSVYNSNYISNNPKKHHVSISYSGKNQQGSPKRSHSIEGTLYKGTKDLLNKSMQEPYARKESISVNIAKSVSINKFDKTQELDNIAEEKFMKTEGSYTDPNLNATILHEVNLNSLDTESEKKLRDLVHKYQLRDVVHRQEILKLKKSNDSMKAVVERLEKELEKLTKNRELEKKYIYKLESELSQYKEKARLGSVDKKMNSTPLPSDKENKYLRMIDELKAQVNTLTSEKKLAESLLKNSLLQNDMAKENRMIDNKKIQAKIINITESAANIGLSSSKSMNFGGKMKVDALKADSLMKKVSETENLNDENDFSAHARQPPHHQSFMGMPSKYDKSEGPVKNPKESSINLGKIHKMLTQDENFFEMLEVSSEIEESFPDKVAPPRLKDKSLKERMDMTQFKLDFTRIGKPRKVE